MHLRKLLITLVSLSFILAFNTSCDNDRDKEEIEPSLEMSDLANTYSEKKLIINATEAGEDISVIVTIDGQSKATFKLLNVVGENPEVTFTTDIVKKESGIYSFSYADEIITEIHARNYKFEGSFVGNSKDQAYLVIDYSEVKYLNPSDLPKSYREGALTINDKSYTSKSVYAQISKIEGNTVKLSLAYVIPQLGMFIDIENVTLQRTNDDINTFTFNTTFDVDPDRTITVSGRFEDEKLHLKTSTAIKSEWVANWGMNFVKIPWIGNSADIRVKLDTKNAGTPDFDDDELSNSLSTILGIAIEKFVSSVNLNLQEDGLAKISFSVKNTKGESTNTELPIAFNYTIDTKKDGSQSVSLFVDGDIISMLEPLLEGTSIKYADVLKLFTAQAQKARYYITFSLESDGEGLAILKLDEKAIKSIATIGLSVLPTQEEMNQILPGIPVEDIKHMLQVTAKAQKGSSLGIGFKKAE